MRFDILLTFVASAYAFNENDSECSRKDVDYELNPANCPNQNPNPVYCCYYYYAEDPEGTKELQGTTKNKHGEMDNRKYMCNTLPEYNVLKNSATYSETGDVKNILTGTKQSVTLADGTTESLSLIIDCNNSSILGLSTITISAMMMTLI